MIEERKMSLAFRHFCFLFKSIFTGDVENKEEERKKKKGWTERE
jgi:hypothetical protein